MKNLTLRIEALEAATPTAPPQAPPRKEGGRANGHRVVPQYQGADGKNSSLHHTLVKGERLNTKSPHWVDDTPETSSKRNHIDTHNTSREFKHPKLDFLRFEGEHPRILKERSKNTFPWTLFQFTCGYPLPHLIFMAMLLSGSKLMKCNTL